MIEVWFLLGIAFGLSWILICLWNIRSILDQAKKDIRKIFNKKLDI